MAEIIKGYCNQRVITDVEVKEWINPADGFGFCKAAGGDCSLCPEHQPVIINRDASQAALPNYIADIFPITPAQR